MRKWLKLLLVIAIFALISVALYFILRAFGLTNIETLRTTIERAGKYAIIVFFLVDVTLSICFAFIPILDTAMVVLGVLLFGEWTGFILSLIGNLTSGSILFFIGDKFGEKLAVKLIGKNDLEHAQNLIDKKSKFIFPLLFALPFTPDEALCVVAGMTKMKYLFFIITLIICRSICIGMLCFASAGVINF